MRDEGDILYLKWGGEIVKKSLYRKVIFGLLVICVILLIVNLILICLKLHILQNIANYSIINLLRAILTNTYFSGVCCSVIAVIVIYFAQVKYSKRMLKKDFRCNEVIQDIYTAIETYMDISDRVPERTEWSESEEFLARKKRDSTQFYKFYKQNEPIIKQITTGLTYENNNLLLESVQSCFLINLNFKLLSIINNVKNRLFSLRPKYEEVLELCKSYESAKTDETLFDLGDKLFSFFVDLKFMTLYWNQLLDYLEYDPTYIRLFIKLYNSKYSIEETLMQPIEIQNSRVKGVNKAVRREKLLYKIRHFWDK